MSYKHNNLMAMRQSWWDDSTSLSITEKQFFKQTLIDQGVYKAPTLEDVKFFFFSLPSIIIVKGYALGFTNENVLDMITQYIVLNKESLSNKIETKIQFRM